MAAQEPQQPAYRPSFTRLALIVAIALAIMLGGYQYLGLGGPAMQLRLEFGQERGGWLTWLFHRRGPLDVPQPEGATATLELDVTLRNRGGEAQTLRADDPCLAVQWFIEDAPGSVIASKGEACPREAPQAVTVASGESLTLTETLTFPAPSFEAGRIYRINVSAYGVVGYTDVRFVKE
jgi:hypothetical protein